MKNHGQRPNPASWVTKILGRHSIKKSMQLSKACSASRPYDFTGAARVGLRPGARTSPFRFSTPGALIILEDEVSALRSSERHDASFFCSELIFRAFEIAGAPIVKSRPHLAGPGALERVDTVTLLGNLQLPHKASHA